MRIRKPGKIRDHLWYLGREESGVYLLEGSDESMIISGGLSYIVPLILSQFKEFGIHRERITKLLILHSHFDHVGIVPYFKHLLPDLQLYASERAWEILKMPQAIETINSFSRKVAEKMGTIETLDTYDLDWREGISGISIQEGESINLGNLEVLIFDTPGHSSCSISAYVPQFKALFPSDGGGIPYRDTIITSGNSNFTKFQQSLEKLRKMEVEYHCADHYGYIIGEEARHSIQRAIELAGEFRAMMEDTYRRTKDIDLAAKEVLNTVSKGREDYFMSPEVQQGVYRQMVRHIANAEKI